MKHRIARWLLLLLVFAPAAVAENESDSPIPPAPEALGAAIDAYVQPFVDRGHLSGNLLVARGEDIVYERSFGMASYELGVPVTPDSRFNIASVSKPMTVIALIHLVTRGKLAMSDPISKWIPDFPRAGEITVGHLARHRAGIPHRVTEAWQETVPHTASDMVELAKNKPLTGEPGEKYNYSSAGFSVLARVLELAGGKPFDALLREAVFDPVGLTHSSHIDSRALLPDRAAGYMIGPDGKVVNAALKDMSFLVGAGSVFSTARDLHSLVLAVRTGKLGPGPQLSFVDTDGLDWNGVSSAYRAFADWHAASDVTVVFVGNLQTGAATRIQKDVPRITAGEKVALPVLPDSKPIEVATETLKRWEGRYELRPGSPLSVRAESGALYANDWVLIPTGERRFFSPQDYATVEVVLTDAGKPERLDWVVDGEAFPCPRVGDL